jgi:antirestriction protein ArdC
MTKRITAETRREDVYSRVTNRIVERLEQGVRPWTKPWSGGDAAGIAVPLRANGKAYRGVNVLILWMEAMAHGYTARFWMTYRQAGELGGRVRKGEKGTMVVFTSTVTKTETDDDGEAVDREIRFLKTYHVFNAQQIEGLPAPFYTPTAMPEPAAARQRIEHAERFFAQLGADIRHGGNRAYYALQPDFVQMPPFEIFRDSESYYATLGHECVHWTRHPSRLDRDFGRQRWGDAGYAQEELVAELGASFLAADLGLSLEPREDHAAYVADWLTVLRNDRRAIFVAAAHAQRAVDYLHRQQPTADREVGGEDLKA